MQKLKVVAKQPKMGGQLWLKRARVLTVIAGALVMGASQAQAQENENDPDSHFELMNEWHNLSYVTCEQRCKFAYNACLNGCKTSACSARCTLLYRACWSGCKK